MSSIHIINDAHTLANQQLERLRILVLMLSNGGGRDLLPECQQVELDHWMFDLVGQAQTHLDEASACVAQQKDRALVLGGRNHGNQH